MDGGAPAVASGAATGGCGLCLAGRLGFRDLIDEALLTLCLVSAIAAVLTPIMILAGLKFGLIEIMRARLIQDPTFRQILPSRFERREEAFFAAMRARPEIAFVQPELAGSRTPARAEAQDPAKGISIDVMPTSPGDPLLLANDTPVPPPGSAVVTAPLAEALGLKAGDTVRLLVNRANAGRREQQEVALKVDSVMGLGADDKMRVYTELDVARDIERFRSGITVAKRGWIGMAAPPDQVFDAVYLVLDQPMTEADIHQTRVSNGFAESRLLTPAEFKLLTGISADSAEQIVVLVNTGRPASGSQITALRRRVGETGAKVLPAAMKLEVVPDGYGRPVRLDALDPAAFPPSLIEGDVSRWPPWRDNISFIQVERVLLPKAVADAIGAKVGQRLRLAVRPSAKEDASQSLAVAVSVDGIVEGGAILAHPALVGMLARSRRVPLSFDEKLSAIIPEDIPLMAYRAYARSIDDVPALAKTLAAEGQPVITRAQEIAQLQSLDSALTQMTLIIAFVALVGGAAVLIANFYAAVERKKGELSLLRLLGFSRGAIFSMPLLQSLMLSAAGFALALLLFQGFSSIINVYYAGDLPIRGEICRLAVRHIAYFGATTLTIAMLASLVAANRTLQIDPAEALRQE